MRKSVIFFVLILCTVVLAADVVLQITVPESFIPRIVPAIEAGQDAHVSVHIQGSQGSIDPNTVDFTLDFDFRTDRDPNDNIKVHTQKVIKNFFLEWTRAYEKKLNQESNQIVIDALPPTDSNLPDEAIQ